MYTYLPIQDVKDSEGYELVALRWGDREKIRQWRNEQIEVLRQKSPITEEEQKNYFEKIVQGSFGKREPDLILLSLLHQGQCIGYGGLTSIDWGSKRAEISFLMETERAKNAGQYEKDFIHFLTLVTEMSFGRLKLHRLFTETFAFRETHCAILEKFGMVKEGVLREHVFKKGRWWDSILHGLLEKDR